MIRLKLKQSRVLAMSKEKVSKRATAPVRNYTGQQIKNGENRSMRITIVLLTSASSIPRQRIAKTCKQENSVT